MRRIDITGQYKKDLKLARKRNLPEDKLNQIIFKLANDESLLESNKDHVMVIMKEQENATFHLIGS